MRDEAGNLMSGGRGKWPKDALGNTILPDYVEHWVEWSLTPKAERPSDEQTLADYCRKYNLAPDTTRAWRQRGVVRRAMQKRADELNLSTERIQRVIDAMFKAAEQGDVKAASLVLQFADKLQPKRVIIEDRTLAGMSDDELRSQLEAAGLLVGSDGDDD